MEKFTQHRGIAAPLLRINIDTDAIIPSREMKLVSKQGLGAGLFAGWRYLDADARTPNPEFVLNQPVYAQASVLLSGVNFGCGSSREHAVWALKEYGIKAIVAPSFGTIFYNNCTRNGILPIVLSDAVVRALADEVSADPQVPNLQAQRISIDLPAQTLTSPSGQCYGFDIEVTPKTMLVEGLDPIAMTLQRIGAIDAFEQRHVAARPWLG